MELIADIPSVGLHQKRMKAYHCPKCGADEYEYDLPLAPKEEHD